MQRISNDTVESLQNVHQLVENIRGSFIEMLNNATWMDEDTKRLAVDKAKSTKAHIGFLQELSNHTKLEEHYKSLTLNESEFLLNVLRVNKLEQEYSLRQLYEPIEIDDWLNYPIPTTVGAFHVKQKNEIGERFVNLPINSF